MIAIVIIAFTIHFFLDEWIFRDLRKSIFEITGQLGISHIITYSIVGIPILLGAYFLHGHPRWIKSLGLTQSFGRGLLFSFICTIPMLMGFFFVFPFNTEISIDQIIIAAVSASFFEELYFRGFLYGQLYRYTRLGFIPSVVGGAVLFGFIHLYQSQDVATLTGIFLTTLIGAILFSWAYSEWQHNIWIPVFLHFFMNVYWMMFSAGDHALGGIYANVFRVITIVLIITLTIWYKKRKGGQLEINKSTLWMKQVKQESGGTKKF